MFNLLLLDEKAFLSRRYFPKSNIANNTSGICTRAYPKNKTLGINHELFSSNNLMKIKNQR